MTKDVSITIDIALARRALGVAGYFKEIIQATDDEVFEKVLTLLDCYGATFKVKEKQVGIGTKVINDDGFRGEIIDMRGDIYKVSYEVVNGQKVPDDGWYTPDHLRLSEEE